MILATSTATDHSGGMEADRQETGRPMRSMDQSRAHRFGDPDAEYAQISRQSPGTGENADGWTHDG
ncbi:MAG: hypothetical protein H0V44_08160 [Planctomycetes bacterium]|nr:hypothetical protein [Planctomycetota bacterium]